MGEKAVIHQSLLKGEGFVSLLLDMSVGFGLKIQIADVAFMLILCGAEKGEKKQKFKVTSPFQ